MPLFDFLDDLDGVFRSDSPEESAAGGAHDDQQDESRLSRQDLDRLCGANIGQWYYTARLLLLRRDSALVEYCYQRLHELQPQKWQKTGATAMSLGQAAMWQGRVEEAEELLRIAISTGADNLAARKLHLDLMQAIGRPDQERLPWVRAALERSPDDKDLREQLKQITPDVESGS
jgi:hypothetical protein